MSVHNNGKNATKGPIKQGWCWLWAAGKRKVSVLVIFFLVLCFIAIIFETFSLVHFLSLALCWPVQPFYTSFIAVFPVADSTASNRDWIPYWMKVLCQLWQVDDVCAVTESARGLFKFPLSKLVYTFGLKVFLSVYFSHYWLGLSFMIAATAWATENCKAGLSAFLRLVNLISAHYLLVLK